MWKAKGAEYIYQAARDMTINNTFRRKIVKGNTDINWLVALAEISIGSVASFGPDGDVKYINDRFGTFKNWHPRHRNIYTFASQIDYFYNVEGNFIDHFFSCTKMTQRIEFKLTRLDTGQVVFCCFNPATRGKKLEGIIFLGNLENGRQDTKLVSTGKRL